MNNQGKALFNWSLTVQN